ncbi:MAG: hypothetical protein ACSHYB_09545 [Roseibacillus sp.]
MTGFPLLESDLARTVREAALDYESFGALIRACDLRRCRGMCCHDGVFVGAEEREVMSEVLPGPHFEQRGGRWKTRTVAAGKEALGEGFPGHFPKTRCVFLDGNDYCGLQSRAMAEGKHPWFWKPFPCWLHPLGFRRGEASDRPILSLPTLGEDPAAGEDYPGFASCTTCGKADSEGEPAWKVLEPELRFLSDISGRDLVAELRG